MNVLDFIKQSVSIYDSYRELKSLSSKLYTIDIKCGETTRTNVWILKKEKVSSIQEAMVVLIIVHEMKYGQIWFDSNDSDDEAKALDVNLDILERKYDSSMRPLAEIVLSDFLRPYTESKFRQPSDFRYFLALDWSKPLSPDTLKSEKCFGEKVIRSYRLCDKWNDSDYIFETSNYYVRINAGTSG